MTNNLRYGLSLGVSDDANVEEIEELLQEILLDLYDQGDVESIRVTKDGYVESHDSDVGKVIEILDTLDPDNIRSAIDVVEELENVGESDE